LYAAYTQNSYWQVYNKSHSSPFRETNYKPEIFLKWYPNEDIGTSTLKQVRLSFIHQSNGEDLGKSRSWNRSEIYFLLKKENFSYGMNVWNRWNEDTKTVTTSSNGDDNVGLEDYIGKQKYFIKYKTDNFRIQLSHQNDLLHYDISKGNTKIDFVLPVTNSNFDFFIRYFHGYGESLIDYDVKLTRISLGVMLANWK
jgi:phospholipase A1